MEQLPDELRLRAWLSVLRDVDKEYPGNRTMTNVMKQIEARLKWHEKDK